MDVEENVTVHNGPSLCSYPEILPSAPLENTDNGPDGDGSQQSEPLSKNCKEQQTKCIDVNSHDFSANSFVNNGSLLHTDECSGSASEHNVASPRGGNDTIVSTSSSACATTDFNDSQVSRDQFSDDSDQKNNINYGNSTDFHETKNSDKNCIDDSVPRDDEFKNNIVDNGSNISKNESVEDGRLSRNSEASLTRLENIVDRSFSQDFDNLDKKDVSILNELCNFTGFNVDQVLTGRLNCVVPLKEGDISKDNGDPVLKENTDQVSPENYFFSSRDSTADFNGVLDTKSLDGNKVVDEDKQNCVENGVQEWNDKPQSGWGGSDSSPASPGRLRIDAEASDDDPDKLTIDTGEPDSIERIIDKVAKGDSGATVYNPPREPRKRGRRGRPALNKATRKKSLPELKCPRCAAPFETVPALMDHQRICGHSLEVPEPITDQPKTPRKVYLCSSCESYFENWNLFQHMTEMHDRKICLFCLSMFSTAWKLRTHLKTKHGITEQVLASSDELSVKNPGPQLLLCCQCDRMCTNLDFEMHTCICSHCGLIGTHYPTCRLALPPAARNIKSARRRGRIPRRSRPIPIPPRAPVSSPPSNRTLDISPNTYNERMLQLYRVKPQELRVSSLKSIEDTIDRVLKADEEEPPDEVKEEEPEPIKEEEEEPVAELEEPEPEIEAKDEVEDVDMDDGVPEEPFESPEPTLMLAGEEVPFTPVPLSEPLNQNRVRIAMKLFVRATSLTCIYCAHARKIAVNGKQLGLHLLAQHRYTTVAESCDLEARVSSHDAVVASIREALPNLENVYFNAYGFDSADSTAWRCGDRVYECFHCCFSTPDSREFFTHNRKGHQNASHLCIMCKTRFLTYSELLCHLCCGVYVPGRLLDPQLRFRCYACDIQPLPSSFQLMVHLRSVHTSCDICFDLLDSQGALSAHVQKHKFLFYCYACALTYRTRQDVTKHIFWKHGAEGITCKRCLQKKWRHAYHFCLPPPGFQCDACSGWFRSASALRVHQRLHNGIFPHPCPDCEERFISRKLLEKHAVKHQPTVPNAFDDAPPKILSPSNRPKKQKKKKDVEDVFDLPPVNLSESDDSSGDETPQPAKQQETKVPVEVKKTDVAEESRQTILKQRALAEHDYCRPVISSQPTKHKDHDYCDNGMVREEKKKRRRSRSSSSSSSSSSSCSCGSNCSCSHSDSTESTASAESGEPRPKTPEKTKVEEPSVDVGEAVVAESDLETEEPVTDDEDFYEKNPALRASEVLMRNRTLLLDKLEGSQPSAPATSSSGSPRRKMKSKKKRSSMSGGSDGRRPRRKRVPLKYYGYSSGEELDSVNPPRKRERIVEENVTTPAPAIPRELKPEVSEEQPEVSNLWNPPTWRPPPVPPKVNPIRIRTGSLKQTFAKSVESGEFRITRADIGGMSVNGAGSGTEKLYCFCQCPYDEVSEMIACDAQDCLIEWFHFECVGIMVPPKGKWFCPDCKKKAAAESEMLGIPL